MLSILIPTYNFNIVKLVKVLHQQALEEGIDFEIIVMEDGSTKLLDENSEIQKLPNCKYLILKQNIGRSSIRNKLADYAKFEHLLFIDCDAEVCIKYFIHKYLAFCKEQCIVIGGTTYYPSENSSEFSLRLKYGRKREARPATERSKNNFSTFNFLISKSIFNRVRFDETIRSYGHEDMLFGHELQQIGYEFIQIDNPLVHKGLDQNITFIHKTEVGTRNLFALYKSGKYPSLVQDSKLLKSYIQVEKLGLTPIVNHLFRLTQTTLLKFLVNKNPSLLIFDAYKLMFLCKIAHEK